MNRRVSLGKVSLRPIGLVLLVVLLSTMDWAEFARIVRASDWRWLAVAALFNFVFVLIKALRWHMLLLCQGIDYGLSRSLRVYQASTFFSVITPGRLGDVVKSAFLNRDLGVPYSSGMASVVMDRICDLVILFATAGITMLLKSYEPELWVSVAVSIALFMLFTGALFSQKTVLSVLRWAEGFSWTRRVAARLSSVSLEFQGAMVSFLRPGISGPIAMSVLAYAVLYGSGVAIARAQGLPLSFSDCAYCLAVANVVALLPVSVMGIGTRDVAMVIIFRQLGLDAEPALMFSMGYLFINLLFGTGLGAFYWFSEGTADLLGKASSVRASGSAANVLS